MLVHVADGHVERASRFAPEVVPPGDVERRLLRIGHGGLTGTEATVELRQLIHELQPKPQETKQPVRSAPVHRANPPPLSAAFLPGSQTQRGGDVAFGGVVKVHGQEAAQLLTAAVLALLRHPQLLRYHGHGHHEQITVRTASGGAAVTKATSRRLPSATLLFNVMSGMMRFKEQKLAGCEKYDIIMVFIA